MQHFPLSYLMCRSQEKRIGRGGESTWGPRLAHPGSCSAGGRGPSPPVHPPCPSGLEGWLCCSTSENRKGRKRAFNFPTLAPQLEKMPSWIGAKRIDDVSSPVLFLGTQAQPEETSLGSWPRQGQKRKSNLRCFDSLFKNSPALAKGQCLFPERALECRFPPGSPINPHVSHSIYNSKKASKLPLLSC